MLTLDMRDLSSTIKRVTGLIKILSYRILTKKTALMIVTMVIMMMMTTTTTIMIRMIVMIMNGDVYECESTEWFSVDSHRE